MSSAENFSWAPTSLAEQHREAIVALAAKTGEYKPEEMRLIVEESYVSDVDASRCGFLVVGPAGFYSVTAKPLPDGTLTDMQCAFIGLG